MTGYELLLSESQERMLLVVRAGREEEVRGAFERYELHAVTIGRVIDEPVIRATQRGEIVCEVPGRALADEAPRYMPPAAPPADLERRRGERLDDLAAETPAASTLLDLLGGPNAGADAGLASLRPHERDQHARRAGSAGTRRCCGSRARSGRWRLAWTAPAGSATSTRDWLPAARCWRAQ